MVVFVCREGGLEGTEPFFRFADGNPLTRQFGQDVLEQAAIACGCDPRRFRLHSLRSGGTAALYQVRPGVQLIQRFGRWSSDAVHGYLHDSAEQSLPLASQMARDRASVHYA